jgi:hypothetical protein
MHLFKKSLGRFFLVEAKVTSQRTIRGGSELADAERTSQEGEEGEGRARILPKKKYITQYISNTVGSLNGAPCNEIALYRIIRIDQRH